MVLAWLLVKSPRTQDIQHPLRTRQQRSDQSKCRTATTCRYHQFTSIELRQNTESEVTSRTSFHRFEHGLHPDKPLKELVSTNTRVKREKYRRNCAVQSTGPQSQFPPLQNSIHLQFVAPYLICICSSLLDLRSSEGLLDVSQGGVPVHLLEQLINVALLGHQDGTFAIGHRLEELHCQTTRAHLSSQPNPALAIILHLLGLINAIAHTALGHEHRIGHLFLQLCHTHGDVLLADVARRRSLPKSAVALEALRSEITMEELHHQLGKHGALGWIATSTSQQGVVEILDISITDVILTTTASWQRNGAVLAWPCSWRAHKSQAREGEGPSAKQGWHQQTIGGTWHGWNQGWRNWGARSLAWSDKEKQPCNLSAGEKNMVKKAPMNTLKCYSNIQIVLLSWNSSCCSALSSPAVPQISKLKPHCKEGLQSRLSSSHDSHLLKKE